MEYRFPMVRVSGRKNSRTDGLFLVIFPSSTGIHVLSSSVIFPSVSTGTKKILPSSPEIFRRFPLIRALLPEVRLVFRIPEYAINPAGTVATPDKTVLGYGYTDVLTVKIEHTGKTETHRINVYTETRGCAYNQQ